MKISSGILLILTSLLVTVCTTNAQTYAINNGFSNNQTISTCSGTFFDSNINGSYGTFENYTVTFCSGSVGKVMQFVFQELFIVAGDTLFVYDGTSTNANVIETFANQNITTEFGVTVSDTNTTGCLTFRFVSNGVSQAAGWKAIINCGFQCKQKILGTISTTPAKDGNGYTNICMSPNGIVLFDLATSFPDNGLAYNQTNQTSRFHWIFGDGHDTSGINLTNLTHKYQNQGGYKIKVIITDSNGCFNKVPIDLKVRTNIKPIFNIQAPATLCVGDTTKLAPNLIPGSLSGGFVTPQLGSFFQLPTSGDSLFLPDAVTTGTAAVYTSSIVIDQFTPGQTLNNINLLKGIFMNLEHSYLGDIDIAITAPNGVQVFLKSGHGSPDCFLGEPVDGNLNTANDNHALDNIRGKGYDYWFKTNPQFGTMLQEASLHTYSYIDNANQHVNNKNYLPSGSYTSASNLAALVGTTLNGTWILQIRDWQKEDNGFLFNWHLEIDPSLYPSVETFNVSLISQNWVTPATGIESVNGTLATVVPDIANSYAFIYRVIDAWGCNSDTTIKIDAIASPTKPNLGTDVGFCNGQASLNLAVSNPDNSALYNWSNGANGVAISVSNAGTYIVTATNSNSCTSKDTINVILSSPVAVSLGNDTSFCASNHNVLRPSVSNNVVAYLWDNGTTNDSLKINGSGVYSVKASTAIGCFGTSQITVYDNPINSYVMPIDTTICENINYNVTLTLPPNASVVWNDGFTGITKTVYPNNTYSTIANYIGCLKQGSYKVFSKPLPVINIGADTSICTSKTLLLKASHPAATYLWNDNSVDSFLLAKDAKVYWVEATLNQCKYRDSLELKFVKCDCNTVIPNAFSPNNDGINDFFLPKMECVPAQYQLTIFNRYGQQVFDTKNYSEVWKGTLNGRPLPIGTYYYILNYFNTGLAIPERFTGSITILR
jgi:gliding motility-associated-like protein